MSSSSVHKYKKALQHSTSYTDALLHSVTSDGMPHRHVRTHIQILTQTYRYPQTERLTRFSLVYRWRLARSVGINPAIAAIGCACDNAASQLDYTKHIPCRKMRRTNPQTSQRVATARELRVRNASALWAQNSRRTQ